MALLAITSLAAQWYQPSIHPLILSRQADASQVHDAGESPVYRNANAPHGFDFPAKPRKGAGDVKSMLNLGAKGNENRSKRPVYGQKVTNEEIFRKARKFGFGLMETVSSSDSMALAICVESDHLEALQATLASGLLSDSSSGKTPFATLVVPPLHLPEGQPSTLPPSDARRLAAVYTTANAVSKANSMPIVDSNTLFILANQDEVAQARNQLGSQGEKRRFLTFDEVLDRGADVAHSQHEPSSASAAATHSSFWLGDAWVQVTNASFCAGVTSYLGFYPADGIPGTSDRILVEQSHFMDSPSLHLGATASPAGLSLALMALYVGASLSVGPLVSSLDDVNPSPGPDVLKTNPTLIYTSPMGASHFGLALTSVSKRSPLVRLCYASKLRILRRGVVQARNTIHDWLLFDSVRRVTGTTELRGMTVVGEGWVLGQSVLDKLRTHLSCAVTNAWLPRAGLEAVSTQDGKSGTKTRQQSANGDPFTVWTTAPLSQSHVYDVQAFRANNDGLSEMPGHVGPPSVTVELKVTEEDHSKGGMNATGSDSTDLTPRGWDRFISKDDKAGTVYARGSILTSFSGSEDNGNQPWFSTLQPGSFRSNGTLLLLPPSIKEEKKGMMPVPTLSAKYPIRNKTTIGVGTVLEQADRPKTHKDKGE